MTDYTMALGSVDLKIDVISGENTFDYESKRPCR